MITEMRNYAALHALAELFLEKCRVSRLSGYDADFENYPMRFIGDFFNYWDNMAYNYIELVKQLDRLASSYYIDHVNNPDFAKMLNENGAPVYWTYEKLCKAANESPIVDFNAYDEKKDFIARNRFAPIFSRRILHHLEKLLVFLRYRVEHSFARESQDLDVEAVGARDGGFVTGYDDVISYYSTAEANAKLSARIRELLVSAEWKDYNNNYSPRVISTAIWKGGGWADGCVGAMLHVLECSRARIGFANWREYRCSIYTKAENKTGGSTWWDGDGYFSGIGEFTENHFFKIFDARVPASISSADVRYTDWIGGDLSSVTTRPAREQDYSQWFNERGCYRCYFNKFWVIIDTES